MALLSTLFSQTNIYTLVNLTCPQFVLQFLLYVIVFNNFVIENVDDVSSNVSMFRLFSIISSVDYQFRHVLHAIRQVFIYFS